MLLRCLVLLALSHAAHARIYSPQGAACNASDPSQSWTFVPATGALTGGSGQCLSAAAFPAPDGTRLTLQPCSGSPAQAFALAPGNLIVLAAQPATCVNLAGYGTTPGTQVWLYGCTGAGYSCEGNCDWERPAPPGALLLRNSESGLCLSDGALPQVARTCAPGTASAALPFCDYSLGFEARAADLVARLPLDYKLSLLMLPLPVGGAASLAYPALDLSAFFWDFTAIHGISYFTPATFDNTLNYTSFPHAIAQAASFDLELVARITAATAYEARAVSQKIYRATEGLVLQTLMAEGGPLANSVHDPRWGRTCETYGEDPVLIATMGVQVTRSLQNASSGFLQIASMTRHLLGYHGATDLPNAGEEWVTPQWLVDQHLPAYEALMTTGGAEAVMCACNTMRIGAGDGPSPGGIPSCVHPAYYHLLRSVWNSSAVVQADNEAIFPMWQEHHYYPTLEAAMAGFLSAGGAAVDSGGGVAIIEAVRAGLSNGTIAPALVDAAVQRTFLSRMRLGEFDAANPANPFRGPYDEAQIDGPSHRALAREAAARTLVLLRNVNATLPLNPTAPPRAIAVIGPWGNASDRLGNYGVCSSMGLNYAATTSHVSTIVGAVQAEVAGVSGVSVAFAQGSQAGAELPGGLAAATALAAGADLVILALGLGCGFEAEGVDRAALTLPPPQAQLLAAVALALRPSARLVLVTVSAGLLDLDERSTHAWVSMGYPGEEAGNGLGDVLWGRVSPSGRLPLTGYSNEYLAVAGPTADFNMVSSATGVGRTYRYANHIPDGLIKLHFGSGLSYATFLYTNAAAAVVTAAPTDATATAAAVAPSSVSVTVDLAWASGMAGARQVTQVYVAVPPLPGTVTPRLALQGYTITVPTAQPAQLSFSLPYPGAFYTTLGDGSRQVTGGNYSIFIGGHQPGDDRGGLVSNVLQAVLALPASAVLPCPLPS